MQKTSIRPSSWRVTSSPHIRRPRTITSIMLDVIIALLPAGAMGVYYFGYRAALLIVVSVASSVAWEALIRRAMKKPVTIHDLSAVVTGILLAYNLPVTIPLWAPVIATGIAIVIIKQLFGGLGQNFMNPALAARAVLLASWTSLMSSAAFATDAVTSATPLVAQYGEYSLTQLFLGDVPGCIGETCKLALLLGGIYLMARRVISWRIPLTMIATVFVCFWVASGHIVGTVDSALYQILSGGLFLGAFFIATDYATSPVTPVGRLVMGVGCGLLIFIIRRYNPSYPEGFSYAILVMNLATPLIDRFTRPRVYGEGRKHA